ncbi:putative ribonuclease H-like domain-containing protein [Tanacetum coccineum]
MAPIASSDTKVKTCSKTCLKNYESLKKQYDDLLVKLNDTGFKSATYKRVTKEYQLGYLGHELEKVKQENEGFDFKIAKFDKSAKDLNEMLENLSYSSLDEFKEHDVNENGPRDSSLKPITGCDKESKHLKENTDDSLEQHQMTDTETSSFDLHWGEKFDKDRKEKFFLSCNHWMLKAYDWNIAHLLDFKDFDGGYVTFGGEAYGGRITSKGTQRVSESSISSQQDQDNQDCIVMPIWKDASYFGDAAPRSVTNAQIQDKDGLHDENDATEKSHDDSIPTTPHIRIHKDQLLEQVIGDVRSSVQTRRMKTSYSEQGFLSAIYEGKTHQDLHTCLFACFLSQEEPKRVSKALSDPTWVEAMQEELLQFKLQKVWILVDLPKGHRAIGTKWVYRNKKDEMGIVIRNKARLVAQVHTQDEGIDYDEVFAPVARIEAIRMFLAYASYMGFMVYQMDVKSAFLYGQTEEEHQELDVKSASTPTGLEKPLVQDGDVADVDEHLYRSMIGSLMYLTASRLDIMFAVCACARFQVSLKSSHLLAVKRIFRYLKGKPSLGLWYSKDSPLEFVAYTDSDYAGATQDRKSTTGGYLLTKGFDAGRFQYLVSSIGMLNP